MLAQEGEVGRMRAIRDCQGAAQMIFIFLKGRVRSFGEDSRRSISSVTPVGRTVNVLLTAADATHFGQLCDPIRKITNS